MRGGSGGAVRPAPLLRAHHHTTQHHAVGEQVPPRSVSARDTSAVPKAGPHSLGTPQPSEQHDTTATGLGGSGLLSGDNTRQSPSPGDSGLAEGTLGDHPVQSAQHAAEQTGGIRRDDHNSSPEAPLLGSLGTSTREYDDIDSGAGLQHGPGSSAADHVGVVGGSNIGGGESGSVDHVREDVRARAREAAERRRLAAMTGGMR